MEPWTKPKYTTVAGEFPEDREGQGAVQRALLRPDRGGAGVWSDERSSASSSTDLETKKYKLHVRVFLSRYRGYALCPECRGARLRKEALYVRVGGKNHRATWCA